jgi:hypothetical protein
MKMVPQVLAAASADSRWSWLYKIGGAAALISGLLFLVGLISLISAGLQAGAAHGWFPQLENNWLVVLFKLNAGFSGFAFERLVGPNALDIAILALVGTMYLGIYAALRHTHKIGAILAAVQPFLGIALFVATKLAGRSGVMGAELVISLVMLRGRVFGKGLAWMGLLASLLLLVGDFGTTENVHSSLLAICLGIGYVLMLVWIFMIARRLFQLGRSERRMLLQPS